MSDKNNIVKTPPKARLNPDLKDFEKLIGTWELSGGVNGKITFEWLESGFFLAQRVDLMRDGHTIKGIEIIGHEKKFGEEPSAAIKSRFYGFNDGATFDYVYEMEGNELTIWGGEKGSSSFMKGNVSEDGSFMTSEWTYLGDGYKTSGKRIK